MHSSTQTRLVSLKLLRNLLILTILTAGLLHSTGAKAAISWLVPANLCYLWALDSPFPGVICAQFAYCSPEDSLPTVAANAWGTCPNGVPVGNTARSFGSVGSYGVQAQGINRTVYFVELGRTVETAFCNGNTNVEHVPTDITKCSSFNPPPGLPPDVCFEAFACNHQQCLSYGNYWDYFTNTCSPEPVSCPGFCRPYQPLESGGCYDPIDLCAFEYGCPFGQTPGMDGCCCNPTPVVIDVAGNGIALTDAYTGVRFDFGGNGRTVPSAWTTVGTDDAWLALDRNSNGQIDNAKELFGNFTDQPHATTSRNGFVALAEFDRTDNGGNGDRKIDQQDSVFGSLRLWQDGNHNGVSEASELHTLSELGIASIDCDYKESKQTDQFGNQFRYRSKVKDIHGAQVGRWAWDVIPKVNPPPQNP